MKSEPRATFAAGTLMTSSSCSFTLPSLFSLIPPPPPYCLPPLIFVLFPMKVAESVRPKLEACTRDLHSLLNHVPGYEIEDNKVRNFVNIMLTLYHEHDSNASII